MEFHQFFNWFNQSHTQFAIVTEEFLEKMDPKPKSSGPDKSKPNSDKRFVVCEDPQLKAKLKALGVFIFNDGD
jgi:hypothetical protein